MSKKKHKINTKHCDKYHYSVSRFNAVPLVTKGYISFFDARNCILIQGRSKIPKRKQEQFCIDYYALFKVTDVLFL